MKTFNFYFLARVAPIPEDLTFSDISHTSVCLTWNVGEYPKETIDYYLVIYAPADGSKEPLVIKSSRELESYNRSRCYITALEVAGPSVLKLLVHILCCKFSYVFFVFDTFCMFDL